MQQFTVPQFIDVEDKIIGPVTTRQFVIMMICAVLIAIEYKLLYFTTWVVIGLGELVGFGILAFIKINGRPFHYFILNIVQTLRKPRLRVWNQTFSLSGIASFDIEDIEMTQEKRNFKAKQTPTKSRLTELSLIVDTKGGYSGETSGKKINIDSAIYSENSQNNIPTNITPKMK